MVEERQRARNFVLVDEAQLDKIVGQLPNSYSVVESLKVRFGVSIKLAKFELETTFAKNSSATRKIRLLERYLERNGVLNRSRPRRMPRAIVDGSQYWWVKETFFARKVIIPTPVLREKFGILALTVWVSDPKRAPKPKDKWDWTGSFLFLPTVHYEDGKTNTCWSGCSALQFIVNAALDRPLLATDSNEPFGRSSNEHPIEKLSRLGAHVTEERWLESLYYVRYITDEQTYLFKGAEVRVNDIVGYPIYISASPKIVRSKRPIAIEPAGISSVKQAPLIARRAE